MIKTAFLSVLSDGKAVFFYVTGNFSKITCHIKISPRDAQLAAEKFALRHRSRAKCVRAHTFLCYILVTKCEIFEIFKLHIARIVTAC